MCKRPGVDVDEEQTISSPKKSSLGPTPGNFFKMKNKKRTEMRKPSTFLIIVLLVLMVYILFAAIFDWFPLKEKFNPDKHIILEIERGFLEEDCYKISNPIDNEYVCWIPDIYKDGYNRAPKNREDFLSYNKSEGSRSGRGILKWRPKTICELNPEAEGCLCDEYEKWNVSSYCETTIVIDEVWCLTINRTICIMNEDCYENTTDIHSCFVAKKYPKLRCYYVNGTTCIKAHEAPTPIKINLEVEKCVEWITSGTVEDVNNFWTKEQTPNCGWLKEGNFTEAYNISCCLKSEPLSECEKGNENYILVDDCEKGKCKCTDLNCSSVAKTCRKKTIQDVSCEELNKHLLIDENLYFIYGRSTASIFEDGRCPEGEYLRGDGFCGKSYRQLAIYNEYIKRGCAKYEI